MLLLSTYSLENVRIFLGQSFRHRGHFYYASCQSIYLVLRSRDACKEDKHGNEEADAEVQVDSRSWAFDGADQRECQDADEQAD